MRKIDKLQPIQSFTDFVSKKKPTNWEDCENEVRNATKEYILLNEQYFLCGYTEIYTDLNNCHIDHYIKRDLNNGLCYNWNNLIVAVNDDDFGARHKDGVKGVKNLVDYGIIFNPVYHKTQDLFRYTTDGKIHPAVNLSVSDFNKAENTITIFNLNHASLKSRRQVLIQTIGFLKNGGVSNESVIIDLENQGFKSVIEYAIINYYS